MEYYNIRMKTVQQLTSVFNILQIQDEEIDYKKLYQKEKKMRTFYEKKTRQLEGKLRTYLRDNRQPFGRARPQDIQEIIQDIRSFKSMLPNSVKDIPALDSDQSITNHTTPPLLNEWAIYGLTQPHMAELSENTKSSGSTLGSNLAPSQILEHSAKLVFPSGTSIRKLTGRQALDCSLQIINLSKQKLKSFILTFEPASIQKQERNNNSIHSQNLDIMGILNPERRLFAVCIELDEFTLTNQGHQEVELKTHRTGGTAKSVKFRDISSAKSTQDLQIIVSKRVYCIFSYYPFFGFFEELLKSLLYAVKVERYIRYKEGGENLSCVDSKSHSLLMRNALEQLRKEAASKAIVTGKLLDFSVCGSNKAYLQLSKESLTFCMAEEWAYYVLSLFTLDVFLDLLTLMMLQEKIVFVCPNAAILTHAVFLFTKVLIKPFEYPYPVVNLIPDQEEYLNAPFPIVYGYLKSKAEVVGAKLPRRFKNVYVFFEPGGVEIFSEEDKRKVLNKKSPRLRDHLISKFKKMRKNFPSVSFFSFMQKQSEDFQFPVNIELAREIIAEVYRYVDKEIYRLLPSDAEVEDIRSGLLEEGVEEEDVNHETFSKIKQQYGGKSKDPFFSAFLETQLFNVHIFRN